jgi:hypothetical protein
MKDPNIDWLLEPRDPSIRLHALIDLVGRKSNDEEVVTTRQKVRNYGPVKRILAAQNQKGYWPPKETCYRPKWTSAVWPLALLGEMEAPVDSRIKVECERFLDLHQADTGAFVCPSKLETKGKRWDEPCLTGNMIRTLSIFGYGEDKRVKKAIAWLPKQQLEDGGWNCDYPEKKVKHSSFMSTVEPLWAYSEIPRQKWSRSMKRSIDRGAEFLLMHHVYKSDNHHWKETYPFFTALHFPMYYFYDILHGLRVLTKLGYADDERIRSATNLLLSKRRPDGSWNLEGDWFREGDFFYPSGKGRKAPVPIEKIGEPSKWITLNSYRVLAQTGDLEIPREYK